MVDIIISLFIALALFFIGSMTQAWKKFVAALTKVFCKLFRIAEKELSKDKQLKIREEFREKHPEIKKIKKGNIGMKKKRSINIFALIVTLLFAGLIIGNLDIVSGNIITVYLTNIIQKLNINIGSVDINTTYTAITFSLFSFGLGRLWNDWKATKEMRVEKRISNLKSKAIKNMSSKELIEAAKLKDKEMLEKINKEK